jgi:hypothetical protein
VFVSARLFKVGLMKSLCLNVRRCSVLFATLGAVMFLSGCAPAPESPNSKAPNTKAPEQDLGYLRAPVLTSARVLVGTVLLKGRAANGARVRLSNPYGQALGTTASDTGDWSIEVPTVVNRAEALQLYGLSQDRDGRMVQAEGYIAVLPDPVMPAVLLRAGTGARLIGPKGARIASVLIADFDGGGGLAVSGQAAAGQAVKAGLDGVWLAQARADRDGHFSFALPGATRPGEHQVSVQLGARTLIMPLDIQAVRLEAGRLYQSAQLNGGWRIDWTTPSGAVQSTVIMVPSPQGKV